MSEATERPNAFYAPYRPTIWERLGFHDAHAPRPDEQELADGWAPSWFIVRTGVHLDWRDRLRVMISGNLRVEQVIKTDVEIKRSDAASAVGILPPGAMSPP